jgi:hypothetical protein
MTDEQPEQETDEPNEFGFAGGATAPQPEPSTGEGFGESIAVPAGDLTGAIVAAMEPAEKDEDVPATTEVDGQDN